MFYDFDALDFDKPVSIYGVAEYDSFINSNDASALNNVSHIQSYELCPDSIIMFFRDIATQSNVNYIRGNNNSTILCFSFSDCVELFMQNYKKSGDDEFDFLAQAVIELAILKKSVRYLILEAL